MYAFNPNILPEKKGTYIVGGSIRDRLLGQRPTDYDIAVSVNPETFARKMANTASGRIVTIGKQDNQIFRVITDDFIFDISLVNGPSIEDDLKKRDFTINAMAYSFTSGQLIDTLGGQKDLSDQTVRMVSESVFTMDPIRLLRAFRIAAVLNFEIDPHTISAINKYVHLIMSTAKERIKAEWFRILKTPTSHRYLSQMIRSRLLFEIFPELENLKHCHQNIHHSFDVFEHTIKAYYHIENLLNNLPLIITDPTIPIHSHLDENRKSLIKYAILLHDIGKPSTKSEDRNGNIHFFGHGSKSADMAKLINQKLRLSNSEAAYVDAIIRNHGRPLNLMNLHQKNQLTKKNVTRFFMNCGCNTPDILLHSIADHKGKGPAKNGGFIDFAIQMIKAYYVSFKPEQLKPALLTGDDLIEIFGLTPSPLFKTILNHVEELRLSGQAQSKKDAILLVKKFLGHRIS